MALPVATRQPKRRRLPVLDLTIDPLPPWAEALAPEPVRMASDAHRGAVEEANARRRQALHAASVIEQAEAADREAAAKAVSAGETAPTPKVGKAQAAKEGADLAVEAARETARQTQFSYLTELNEHRDEFAGALGEALASIGKEAGQLVAELERLFRRHREARHLQRELEQLAPAMSRANAFRVPQARPGSDPLEGGPRKLLDRLRGALRVPADESEPGRAAWQ